MFKNKCLDNKTTKKNKQVITVKKLAKEESTRETSRELVDNGLVLQPRKLLHGWSHSDNLLL